MNVRHRLHELLTDNPERPVVAHLRHRILHALLIAFCVSAPVPVALGSIRALSVGQPILAILYTSLLLGLILTAAMGSRMTFRTRACTFIVLGMALGGAGMLRAGLVGIGMLILATFVVLALVLLGTKAAIATLAGSLALMAVAGTMHATGVSTGPAHDWANVNLPQTWVNAAIAFTVFTSMIVTAPALLLRRLH